MFKKFVIVLCFILAAFTNADEVTIHLEEGALKLEDVIDACQEIATCKSSQRVSTSIPGKIITINGTDYEVRFFSFEDTTGKTPGNTTFREYAKQSNLLTMKSAALSPLPGIHFESFDFRRNPIKDGVYFSMALRKVEK
ncbi:MAG: hypothetical protein K2Y18_08140 [Alphaproteobacteria bacterium]|jgi:hypothetical protein|nr:hypothetical protein [Alphaproteobacteria bacterium]